MKKTRIVVADDHTLVRQGVVALLSRIPDFEVAAEVSSGDEALRMIELHRPEAAVVDISMPKLSGIEVARSARDAKIPTAIILLTVHVDRPRVEAALGAGISGYVVKDCDAGVLVEAIRSAASGEVYLSPRVAAVCVDDARRPRRSGDQRELTPRERDVLRLLASGMTSKEIGAALKLASRSVDTYRFAIMEKLSIRHVPGLVKYAVRHGLATLDD